MFLKNISLKTIFNPCTLLICTWILYSFHWFEVSPGSIIDNMANLFLAFNLSVSLFIIFGRLYKQHLPQYFHAVNVIIIWFSIYGIIPIIVGGDVYSEHGTLSPGSYVIGILRSFLPMYAFYYFAKCGFLNDSVMKIWFAVLLLVFIYFNLSFSAIKMLDSNRDGFTNNLGYLFVSLIPFIYFFNKKIFQIGLLLFLMAFVIFSMKRGAILVGILATFLYIFWTFKNTKGYQWCFAIILFVIIGFVAAHYLEAFYADNAYFQMRVDSTLEGDSSSRDQISSSLLNWYVYKANIFQQLFGAGADATLSIYGIFAHNDWLEILIDQGVVGVILYLWYWSVFYKNNKRFSKGTPEYMILTTVLVSCFSRCFFSMSYNVIPVSTSLLMGYCLAQNRISSKLLNKN